MAQIKLSLDFTKMLDDIKAAGGDIEKAAKKVASECADVMADELRGECNASGVPASITREIESGVNVTSGGNVYEVEVGWKKGEYDPKNPSAAYKAIFLNYGTPKERKVEKSHQHLNINGEWVTFSKSRGVIRPRGFIDRARKGAKKKVKKVQRDALNEMLKELK